MSNPADLLRTEPHRRYDPLRDSWVLVSPGRTNRPWAGAQDASQSLALPRYDPSCYLCPGNTRANGDLNPDYQGTFVFDNDFAALRPDTSSATYEDGLLVATGTPGASRVICFSARHNQSLGELTPTDLRAVIDVWANETADLGRQFAWVQVFENRGSMMGASSPHPHGQIWASSAVPVEAAREQYTQARHFERNGRRLLADYADQERDGARVIIDTDEWLVVVPFWAVWPFETLILPRRSAARLPDLDNAARDSLADAVRTLVRRYDGLFDVQFPYSMGWHQAPFDGSPTEPWMLHAHIYPPLLRSASVRKFLVGYELLAEPQRDLTPEEAAERLRASG